MHRKVTIYETSKMVKNMDILLIIHIQKFIRGRNLAMIVTFIKIFEFGLTRFLLKLALLFMYFTKT